MIKAKDIELVETCGACPEQYDAMLNGENVGYLRLRFGYFYVQVPSGGEVVYESTDFSDGFVGIFESDEQRRKHLKKARKAIAKRLNSHGK